MNHRTRLLHIVLIGSIALTGFFPGGVAAVMGPQNVAGTRHNFGESTLFNEYKSNESEICVFCHTPHGGTLTGPLWNRNNPASTWTHYGSATLGSYLGGLATNRAMGAESLICMSCHDGSIAINHVINLPNSRGGTPITISGLDKTIDDFGFFMNPNRIGATQANWAATGDLSDDHPISFSYTSVTGNAPYLPTQSRNGELRTWEAAEALGVRFFGGAAKTVECSSCHDPHVDYTASGNMAYTPFLITTNSASALCFACHNK